mmetsp:Transcript_79367/g.233178  ORF Transcript_79367/g.233178 Transcript_79367/m.233178 type:complete len:223 (-) Transcript_79367:91-759(-)
MGAVHAAQKSQLWPEGQRVQRSHRHEAEVGGVQKRRQRIRVERPPSDDEARDERADDLRGEVDLRHLRVEHACGLAVEQLRHPLALDGYIAQQLSQLFNNTEHDVQQKRRPIGLTITVGTREGDDNHHSGSNDCCKLQDNPPGYYHQPARPVRPLAKGGRQNSRRQHRGCAPERRAQDGARREPDKNQRCHEKPSLSAKAGDDVRHQYLLANTGVVRRRGAM